MNAAGSEIFVSVVMPLYNAERFVREALQSIAAQQYRNFEVIVVDDGSTDRSPAIAEEFCAADGRFRLIRQGHEGVCVTRNHGVAEARGSWIALCDADDAWLEDKLARQVAFVQEAEGRFSAPVILVGSCGYRIDSHSRVIDRFQPCGMHEEEEYLARRGAFEIIYLLNSSVMFRKEIFERVGGYRLDYEVAQDVDLFHRMAPHGIMLNLREPLTLYRVHDSSASTRKFVLQSLNAERSAENARRRSRGEPELSLAEYESLLKGEGTYKPHIRMLRSWSLYRNAGAALTGGRYIRGAWLLTRAFMVAPVGLVGRLKRRATEWQQSA